MIVWHFSPTCVIPFSNFAFYSFVQKYAGCTLAMYCVSAVWDVLEILNLMGATCNLMDNVKQGIYCNINFFLMLGWTQDPEMSRHVDWLAKRKTRLEKLPNTGIRCFLKVCFTPLCSYKRPTLVPVSLTERNSKKIFEFTEKGEKCSVRFAVKPLQRQCAPWGRARRALSWEPRSASSVQLPELSPGSASTCASSGFILWLRYKDMS